MTKKNKIDTILVSLVVLGFICAIAIAIFNAKKDRKIKDNIEISISSTTKNNELENNKDIKGTCYSSTLHILIDYKNPISPVFGADSLYQAYCQKVISPSEFNKTTGRAELIEKVKEKFKSDTKKYKKCNDKVTCANSKKIVSFIAEPLFIFAYDKSKNSIKLKIYGTNANENILIMPQKDAMCDYLATNNNGVWNIQLLKKYKIKNRKIAMKNNDLHILAPSVEVKDKTPSWNQLWQ